MSRTQDRDALRELARQLVSTTSVEAEATGSRSRWVEDLARMSELEPLVRASFPQPPVKPAAPGMNGAGAPLGRTSPLADGRPASPKAPQPQPKVETARPEYRPALKDPSLIAALMEFHRQSSPKASPAPVPASSAPTPADPASAPPQASLAPPRERAGSAPSASSSSDRQPELPAFRADRVPAVDAVPKDTRLSGAKRAPGRSPTILRPGRT